MKLQYLFLVFITVGGYMINLSGQCVHGVPDGMGGCICDPGYAGEFCNQCAPNYYNYPSCTFCHPAITCNGNGDCNFLGECVCNPGFVPPNCDVLLPVELIGFTGKIDENQVLLSWQTTSESNNAGFEIQRSKDGRDWEILGFVAGKGTSEDVNDYQFVDAHPFGGINYYRLKQVDYDGPDSYRGEYSNVVSVSLSGVDNIRLYPNPTNGQVNVIGLESGTVKVMDSFGRVIKEGAFSAPGFDISKLISGIYFVQISTEGQMMLTQRIFKE